MMVVNQEQLLNDGLVTCLCWKIRLPKYRHRRTDVFWVLVVTSDSAVGVLLINTVLVGCLCPILRLLCTICIIKSFHK
jgi:hypothetical protein